MSSEFAQVRQILLPVMLDIIAATRITIQLTHPTMQKETMQFHNARFSATQTEQSLTKKEMCKLV
jgi:hypothetical protein